MERAKKKNKLTRAELKEKAKTDPEAAKQLEAMRAKEAEARQRKRSVRKRGWQLIQSTPP